MLACIDLFPASGQLFAPGLAFVAANTALCFALCGSGMVLVWHEPERFRHVIGACGAAVLAIAIAKVTQPLHGLYADSLALQHLLNAALDDPRPDLWPRHMRAGTGIAFLFAGAALAVLPWLKGRMRVLVPLAGFTVTMVALPSLFSNLLGNVLFDSDGLANLLLPLPAALGLIAVGLGLVCTYADDAWPGLRGAREDRRIFVTSFVLFSVMSLVASMAGVGIVGRYAMDHFQDAWLTSFRSNAELFRVSLDGAARRSADIVRFSGLDQDAGSATPDQLQLQVDRLARLVRLDAGASLTVRDASGATLAQAGVPTGPFSFSVALPRPLSPRLYYRDGWRLATMLPLPDGGEVRMDIPLADFNGHYARMNGSGATGETRVCQRDGDGFECFGSRLQPHPTRFRFDARTQELAMSRAVSGEWGLASGPDYRGQDVIAAYGNVTGMKLALVQKIDSDEFYRPLRRQLYFALVGMTLLVLTGATILYWRTHPLVQGLLRARARMDAILNNVPAGVFTFEDDGAILSANRAACQMFGYEREALLEMRLNALMPDSPGLMRGTPGRPVQLAGVRADGAVLALEVLANQFQLGAHTKHIVIVQDVGERIRMEQALRQREASLAHAQQLARIGSWERDLASGAHYWSDETYRIFQLQPGSPEPDYDAICALVHPDDRELKMRADQDAAGGVRDYDATFRVVLPGGLIKVLHSRAELTRDATGRPVRLRGTIQDITEKTWADEQLRKREDEYRALVENSPDVIIRFDREMRCVYVNPAIVRAPGLHPVVAIGRVLDAPTPDSPAAPWVLAVRRALGAGSSDTFEVTIGGHPEPCHYQVQVVPELRQGGKVAAVLATARDISAIRNGEAVLRESQRRLAGIAANTPGAVFQCVRAPDGKRSFSYVSEGVLQLLGESPAAVQAEPELLLGRMLPEERARYDECMERSARRLETLNWEGRARTVDGREIWVNCRATPRRQNGAVIWEGVMFNITESKRNEQQLTESRQLLRELSAHREHVREEERKKVAREVHDELGQALTALRMDVALLRLADGPHSPALLARIGAMKEAVDRTIGIVRNVTSALRPAALDLGLTAALEWQVDDFARRSGIECLLHAGETEVELDDGSATALFRIVQESLTNVAKHAHATEVEITLDTDGDEVRLEVCDNGRGFRPEAPRRPGKFGLMGMRERVLMLGGAMDIRSKDGEGTCIQVLLPMTTQEGALAPDLDE